MTDFEDDNHNHSQHHDQESCNLIINYLPPEFDDNDLKELFLEHGNVTMAKVVKDKINRKSMGYGFVMFERPENAVDAIDAKNGMIIGDKKLKVSHARPSTEEIKNCKLYVTNLPRDFSEHDVIQLFSQYGSIIECRVLQDNKTKVNRGVAFVQYSTRREAQNALSLNGFRSNDSERGLAVKYADTGPKNQSRIVGSYQSQNPSMKAFDDQYYFDPPPSSRLPVTQAGNYPPGPGYFYAANERNGYYDVPHQPHGHVMNPVNGGYSHHLPHISHVGFEPQSNPNYANSFESSSQNYSRPNYGHSHHDNQKLQEFSQSASAVTLIISNLPMTANISTLHELISPYGRILGAQVEVINSGVPVSGNSRVNVASVCGRVQMADIGQAQYAIQALNGNILFEGGLPLQIDMYQGQQQRGNHSNNGGFC